MIKINLTPFEELDDPRWWVPDAIILAIIIVLSFGSTYLYLDIVEQEIVARETEKSNMATETQAMQTEVSKFNDLNQKIATLDTRKVALKRITESKLMRYLPVILMENIQNLKPDKVWLTGLAFVDKKKEDPFAAPPPVPVSTTGTPPPPGGSTTPAGAAAGNVTDASTSSLHGDFEFPVTIEITGSAVDNVAIAEFMLSLKATQNQAFEKSDLRTQLFFSDVAIVFSAINTEKDEDKKSEFVNFKLILNFKEKADARADGVFSQFIDQFRKTGRAQIN
jgi:Tfp pilus assembly protein PilN